MLQKLQGLVLNIHIVLFSPLRKKSQASSRNDSFILMTIHPKFISNVKCVHMHKCTLMHSQLALLGKMTRCFQICVLWTKIIVHIFQVLDSTQLWQSCMQHLGKTNTQTKQKQKKKIQNKYKQNLTWLSLVKLTTWLIHQINTNNFTQQCHSVCTHE